MHCMYALWLFRGPNVRGIQDHKMQGFFGPHNIHTPEFKQPDVKHDQGFCAYELIHPKQVVLTQKSVVVAVHVLLKLTCIQTD